MTSRKVALVFGGAGGIGKETCKQLSGDRSVYATFYHNKADIKNVKFVRCDVSNEDNVKQVIQSVIELEKKIDYIVNLTTARLKLMPFDKLSCNDYLEDIRVNALGSINIIKNVIPYMKQRDSVIISLLSKAVEGIPPTRMASYVSSKYALKGFIKCVRTELRDDKIKIFTLSPSFVETELISVFPSKLLEIEKEKLPGKMFIQPEDIANIIVKIIENPDSFSNKDILLDNRENVLEYLR